MKREALENFNQLITHILSSQNIATILYKLKAFPQDPNSLHNRGCFSKPITFKICLFIYDFLCMGICLRMPCTICTTYMPDAHGGLKKIWDPLELEL